MLFVQLTRQSLSRVLTKAPYVSWSSMRPSGMSFRKSRSLNVGLDFSFSFLEACLLYVDPFRSNLRCMRTERGKILFITMTLMFLPPHWTQYRPKNFGSKVRGFWFKFWGEKEQKKTGRWELRLLEMWHVYCCTKMQLPVSLCLSAVHLLSSLTRLRL